MAEFIARTDGATSGAPTDLRRGELTDIPSAQRGNWREVVENRPAWDRATEQLTRVGLEIIDGGALVQVVWQVVAEPALYARLRLVDLAMSEAERRSQTDRVTLGTGAAARQLITSDEQVDVLLRGKQLIAGGFATTVPVTTANGDVVNASAAQIDAALTAVVNRRGAILSARNTIVGQVRAGTVATSTGVTQHAAWPA